MLKTLRKAIGEICRPALALAGSLLVAACSGAPSTSYRQAGMPSEEDFIPNKQTFCGIRPDATTWNGTPFASAMQYARGDENYKLIVDPSAYGPNIHFVVTRGPQRLPVYQARVPIKSYPTTTGGIGIDIDLDKAVSMSAISPNNSLSPTQLQHALVETKLGAAQFTKDCGDRWASGLTGSAKAGQANTQPTVMCVTEWYAQQRGPWGPAGLVSMPAAKVQLPGGIAYAAPNIIYGMYDDGGSFSATADYIRANNVPFNGKVIKDAEWNLARNLYQDSLHGGPFDSRGYTIQPMQRYLSDAQFALAGARAESCFTKPRSSLEPSGNQDLALGSSNDLPSNPYNVNVVMGTASYKPLNPG